MDSVCVHEHKTIIHELTQGIQLAKQLSVNLHSPQAREFLMQKILTSYDNALFVLNTGNSAGQRTPPALPAPSLPESSISTVSPGSEGFESDQPFSGRNVMSKKRKGSITWEDQVRVCSDNSLDGNTIDGYQWRKYGQKEILGTKYPRSYYRCSYRKVQKCFATKQVQRTNEDPTVVEITYKGKHTCNHIAGPSTEPPPPSPKKDEKTQTHNDHNDHYHPQLSPPNPSETLSNLRANLSVNTTDLGGDTFPSSFSFPSTNYYDDELSRVYSPLFLSPCSSGSNIFTDWGSSTSLDFFSYPASADPDFEFYNTFV